MALIKSISEVWLTFGLILVLLWLRFLWSRRRLYNLSAKVPGPSGFPLIGSAHLLSGTPEEIFRSVFGLFQEFPDLCKVWFGWELFYLVTKPEHIEKILNHPGALNRSFVYGPVRILIGDGLFTGDSDKWKTIRKFLAPSFNQKLLNKFVSSFNVHSQKMVEILKEHCHPDKEIDITKFVSNCTLDMTCETLFDYTINAQERDLTFGESVDRLFELFVDQAKRLWNYFEPIFKRTQVYAEQMETLVKINAISSKIIDTTNEKIVQDSSSFSGRERTKSSFIQNLFSRKSVDPNFLDDNIRNEINTFLVAAVDTNTNSTSFALLLLGMHPEIQNEVFSEIDELTKNRTNSNIQEEDLQFLKCTERVVQETLRLFPPVAVIGRGPDYDVKLDEHVTIPRGSQAIVGIIALHRSEKYWPEPLKFKPDRFLTENMSKRHPYTWLPFSGGPKNCLGYKYAMMSIKVLLATIVKNYHISTTYKTVEDVQLKFNIMTRPEYGFKVFLKPRL